MSDSKKPKLSEIRAREQAATEGPWRVGRDSLDCETPWPSRIIALRDGKHIAHLAKAGTSEKDAAFLVRARTDIPYLLDLVERMGERLDSFVANHSTITTMTPETHTSGYTCTCGLCKRARALLEEIKL